MTDGSRYHIRQLTPGDVGLLRELLTVFADAFEEPETYTADQPEDDYLEELLRSAYFIALVAMHAETVVGGLAAYDLKKFEQDRREIYIYDLAVLEAHRRRGIATDLIEPMRGIAAVRGAHVVFVQADLTDAPAIALYEKLGTREDVLHFDIPVK